MSVHLFAADYGVALLNTYWALSFLPTNSLKSVSKKDVLMINNQFIA
jgi:hypothetical protein